MAIFYKVIIHFLCSLALSSTILFSHRSVDETIIGQMYATWITSTKVIVKSASKQAEMEIALIEMWHVAITLCGARFSCYRNIYPAQVNAKAEPVSLWPRVFNTVCQRFRVQIPSFNYNTRVSAPINVSPSFNHSTTHVAHRRGVYPLL